MAELFADGAVGDSERIVAWETACHMFMVNRPSAEPGNYILADIAAQRTAVRSHEDWRPRAEDVAKGVLDAANEHDPTGRAAMIERTAQASLLRDVVAPFRRLKLEPSWLSWNNGAIAKAAEVAYSEREMPLGHLDNGRLAVLADMLEEAGATDAQILGHLRVPNAVHVRGCWVGDFLLGKE